MPLPTPPDVVLPFAASGVRNAIPVPSQISITPGAASLTDGFPPLTMTPIPSGGIPPAGKDMNGILYELSASVAWLQQGGGFKYSAAMVAQNGGYPVGAFLRSSADASLYWYNTVAANTNDPDVTSTGWVGWRPAGSEYLAATASAGTTHNAAPTGFNTSVGTLDVNPSSGDATWTGLAAGAEGQRIVISNVGATYAFNLLALNAGSSAANQFRAAADMALLPGMTLQLQYSIGAGKWIVIP